MKKTFFNTLLIFVAGIIGLVLNTLWLLFLTFLIEYFKTHEAFEAQLFIDSLITLIGLVWVSIWLLLAGVFLKHTASIKWGRRVIYVYFALSILPYLFSFALP